MNVEAVAEHQVLARTQVWLDFVCIQNGLLLVRDQDHDHVGPLCSLCWRHDFEAFSFCLLAAWEPS